MKNTPLINQWFWEVKYDKEDYLKVTNVFHINSTIDKKYEIIKDWHILVPDEMLIGTDQQKSIARENVKNDSVYFTMKDGEIFLNDRTDRAQSFS
jgi:predicted transcriptional regulator